MRETVLSVLEGESPQQRVVVVMRQFDGGGSELGLRRESWSENVGWYVQSCIDLSTDQITELRAVLGVVPTSRPRRYAMAAAGAAGDEPPVQCLQFPTHRAG